MDTILTIDLGTFCDNTLLLNAIRQVSNTYQKVIYITDENNKVPSNIIKIPYKTPKYFINDPTLAMADPQTNILFWSLNNPKTTLETMSWLNGMKAIINNISIIEDLKHIIILYPAMLLLWHLPEQLLKKAKVYILYYTPGFPNKMVPWIFDSRMRDPTYNIYKSSQDNIESTLSYFKRISMFSSRSMDSIMDTYKKVTHLMAWDPNILPLLKPAPFLRYAKFINIGALIPQDMKPHTQELPLSIQTLLKQKKDIYFITFGSYSSRPEFKIITNRIVKALDKEAYIIIHNSKGVRASKNVILTKGYLPYQSIVPFVKLVIFTGSACLQNVCFYNSIPMCYIPLLTEQFFWAKNYEYNTNVRYLSSSSSQDLQGILMDATSSPQAKAYLKKVSKSMHTKDASKELLRIMVGNQGW
jgi:hypothetical protein